MLKRVLREFLLGPAYLYHRHLIKTSYKWSPSEVIQYYQKKVGDRIINLPVVDKTQMMVNVSLFENRLFRFLTKKVSTGGTSGKPFVFYMDRLFRRQKERAYIFDIWKEIGYKPFDLRVIFRGNVNGNLITYSWLENAYIINPALLCEERKQEILEFLFSLGSFFLHVYPSSLMTFIDFLGADAFKRLPIKGVMAGSEAFPKSQMDHLVKKYDLKFAYWYGHSEYALLARYCNACSEFHFYPTYGYVEFHDLSESQARIIASSYNNIGTKFLRYDTSDIAIKSVNKCTKDSFLKCKEIIGRQQEFFFAKDGRMLAFGPFLFGIHCDFWELFKEIQFQQKKVGVLLVLIVGGKNIRAIEAVLHSRFSKHVSLEYGSVECLPKTMSNKHQYFINFIK